ncbi:MAG TPA: succinate dehydrogenase, hydrophobic membrane anchor protein [Steroidobacteraceae bacterium]
MSLRSPVGRVLGLGAAKEGVEHWWMQRVTAVALVLLGLWFLVSLLALDDFSYAVVTDWLAKPVNAVLMILLVATAAYHSKLGVQVVVEDYIANNGIKIAVMVLLNFLHVALAALGIFAILRVAFGAGV